MWSPGCCWATGLPFSLHKLMQSHWFAAQPVLLVLPSHHSVLPCTLGCSVLWLGEGSMALAAGPCQAPCQAHCPTLGSLLYAGLPAHHQALCPMLVSLSHAGIIAPCQDHCPTLGSLPYTKLSAPCCALCPTLSSLPHTTLSLL